MNQLLPFLINFITNNLFSLLNEIIMILQSDQMQKITCNHIDEHIDTENIQDEMLEIPAVNQKTFSFGLKIIENYLRSTIPKNEKMFK